MTQPTAGLIKRTAAFALDFLFIAAYLLLLLAAGLALNLTLAPLQNAAIPVLDLVSFLFLVLPVILYFTLQQASPAAATWGKRKLRLKVVDAAGQPLTLPRALLRALLKFLPWQLAHMSLYRIAGWPFTFTQPTPLVTTGLILSQLLVIFYLLTLAFTHRTPYDHLAGSYVIQT